MADEKNEMPDASGKPHDISAGLDKLAKEKPEMFLQMLTKIEKEKPEIYVQLLTQIGQFFGHPLEPKLTEEQTSKIIEQKGIIEDRLIQVYQQDQNYDFKLAKSTLTHMTIYAAMIFILLLVILSLYRSTPDFAEKIITAVLSAGLGFGGGYGYCKSKSK
jgi:hypothetical protein